MLSLIYLLPLLSSAPNSPIGNEIMTELELVVKDTLLAMLEASRIWMVARPGSDIYPSALLIRQDLTPGVTVECLFKDDEEKQQKMFALAGTAYASNARAACFVSDTFRANLEGMRMLAGEPPKVDKNNGEEIKAYNIKFMQALNERFGGSMANLPQKYREDFLSAVAIGPEFDDTGVMQSYRRYESGRIEFGEVKSAWVRGVVNVIPHWWKDPRFKNIIGELKSEIEGFMRGDDRVGIGKTLDETAKEAHRLAPELVGKPQSAEEVAAILLEGFRRHKT
jgi:hypothetical protein